MIVFWGEAKRRCRGELGDADNATSRVDREERGLRRKRTARRQLRDPPGWHRRSAGERDGSSRGWKHTISSKPSAGSGQQDALTTCWVRGKAPRASGKYSPAVWKESLSSCGIPENVERVWRQRQEQELAELEVAHLLQPDLIFSKFRRLSRGGVTCAEAGSGSLPSARCG